MNTILAPVVGTAVVSSLVIQWLKKSHWFTFLSTEAQSQKANLVFSIIVAIITSLGITFTYNSVNHQVIIDGLDPASMFSLGIHAFGQWIAQHVAYKTVVVPSELQAAMVTVLKQLTIKLEQGDK